MEHRIVWQAVIVRVIRDLVAVGHANASLREDAERWVGAFPSTDFRMVFECAGVDHLSAHRVLKAACALPAAQRQVFLDENDTPKRSTSSSTALLAEKEKRADLIAA